LSCGKEDDPGVIAATTAKGYYDLLVQEKYDEYVDGLYKPDSIPESYRKQLVDNAKMFIGQQKEEHGGISEVRIIDCKADTSRHIANAFLTLTFGDNSTEEVVVPMVEVNGRWLMR